MAIRFIHAADLHLDAAFLGLARGLSPELARHLHEATFVALRRLVELCAREKPDFLVLAGDIYNQEEQSVRAQLALRDACETLNLLGVRVFLAHGNHDPLSSRLKHLTWPENVTVFSENVEVFPVKDKEGRVAALVHGVSHGNGKEKRNLAAWFRRQEVSCPQIGVLHGNAAGLSGKETYAPFNSDDLLASGLDYWALGHIHEYRVVCRDPLAVYPGSPQGLDISEQGRHGCVLVRMEYGAEPVLDFRPLAQVGWQIVECRLEEELDNLPDLTRLLRERLDALPAQAWPGCQTMIARLCLSGRSPLDSELRRPSVLADLADELRRGSLGDSEEDDSPGAETRVWLKDIKVDTQPLIDRAVALVREDLLGEVLRQSEAWSNDAELAARKLEESLGDLYTRARRRSSLLMPGPEDAAILRQEAEKLCLDLLENN